MNLTPPTVENGWTGKIHYKSSENYTYCSRPILEDWRTVDGVVDCGICIKAEQAGRNYRELSMLRETNAVLMDALREIEIHHVEQNRIKGRDESRSATLRIIRDAIAKGES